MPFVTPRPGGLITIRWKASDDEAVFSVEDSGVGIASHHIPRLTERFYRVDTGRSRSTGGTGLGLAIVKHVLLRHEGWLEIESELDKGSEFRCHFPLERCSECDHRSVWLSQASCVDRRVKQIFSPHWCCTDVRHTVDLHSLAISKQKFKQGFLGVQTVFRFLPDHALWPVDYIGGHFLAAVSRQAVHENRILVGAGHQLGIDLEPGENLFALALFLFLAHAGPHVGDYQVRAFGSFKRVFKQGDPFPALRRQYRHQACSLPVSLYAAENRIVLRH